MPELYAFWRSLYEKQPPPAHACRNLKQAERPAGVPDHTRRESKEKIARVAVPGSFVIRQ